MYIHIHYHIKTSNDYEILEIDVNPSKDRLEDICDIKQPVLFNFDNEAIIQTTCISSISDTYKAFEMKIRNAKDTDYSNQEIYIPLPLYTVSKLLDEDKQSSYFSENNSEFLLETGIIKHLQYNDEFLRPYMMSNCYYDIMLGSDDTITPFRYEINYRNYFMVTQGSVQIKLSPPQNSKYLQPCNDYENFEFRSPVNPWSVQPEFSADFDKMKCLEITVSAGKTVHIPAYWWYSIKFSKGSSISCFKYRTYMNNMAIIPQIGLHVLQIQNVKRNITKKMDIQELNKKKKREKNQEKSRENENNENKENQENRENKDEVKKNKDDDDNEVNDNEDDDNEEERREKRTSDL